MEYRGAVDAGDVTVAEQPGAVTSVSADLIEIAHDDGTYKTYRLSKFRRSNQGTCINQRPLVTAGQRVEMGTPLADGPCTDDGRDGARPQPAGRVHAVGGSQLRGRDHPVSQRLVQDDVLTSIHIEEHEVDARDTKLGAEEITRDIPNVSEEMLADLDERGIIRIGAEVSTGDILVGKVTPKGETELTPEERLLRAIFGEKAREVRDTSLKVPHGESGTVIGVRVFDRDSDDELRARRQPAGPGLRRPEAQDLRRRQARRPARQQGRHLQDPADRGHAVPGGRHRGRHRAEPARRAEPDEHRAGARDPPRLGRQAGLGSGRHRGRLGRAAAHGRAGPRRRRQEPRDAGLRRRHRAGDHRPAGRTLPTRDGDHLVNSDGKAKLFDGRSGEPFPEPVGVGYIYMLKLHHLVDDKIHARSTGPYSMITQQPLGGKAQFGGQRFGEMEVWALEAYGAAWALQELLTIKSDDVPGRVKVYEAIVKGENIPEPGIPESFKVLVKEMKSLCLNVEVLSSDGTEVELRDSDDDYRGGEDFGIDLSRRPGESLGGLDEV